MSDKEERELAEMDNTVGEEVKAILVDACDRMDCERKDIEFRIGKGGTVHVRKRKNEENIKSRV